VLFMLKWGTAEYETAMETLFAETSVGITDLKKNPSAIIREAGDSTVVILHHNKPSAYLVPVKTFEAIMDILDDLMLVPLIQERLAHLDDAIEVTIADLERDARAKLSAQVSPPLPGRRKG